MYIHFNKITHVIDVIDNNLKLLKNGHKTLNDYCKKYSSHKEYNNLFLFLAILLKEYIIIQGHIDNIKADYNKIKMHFNNITSLFIKNYNSETYFNYEKYLKYGADDLTKIIDKYDKSNLHKFSISATKFIDDIERYKYDLFDIILMQSNVKFKVLENLCKFNIYDSYHTYSDKTNIIRVCTTLTEEEKNIYRCKQRHVLKISDITIRNIIHEQMHLIQNKSKVPDSICNIEVKIKTLENAIFMACGNSKSIMTNYQRYKIHKFRIRPLKNNRPSQTMRFHSNSYYSNTIYGTVFGQLNATYNGKKYDLNQLEKNKKEVTLRYVKKLNEYY